MIRFTMQLLVLALLASALGCNKAGGNSAKSRASGTESASLVQSVGTEGSDRVLGSGGDVLTGSALPTEQEEQVIRQDVIAVFTEEDSYTFDQASGSIKGGVLPEDGVNVDSIVPLVYSEIINRGAVTDEEARRRAIAEFKSRFIGMIEAEKANPNGAEKMTQTFEDAGEAQRAAAVDPAAAMPKEGLRFCVDPVGEWRSTKEVLDADAAVSVEHNDQYYKLLQIFYGGNCRYQVFNNGEVITDGNYPWSFDPGTGKLLLRTADGSIFDELLVMDRPSEPRLIYVKGMQDYQYTVYEKVGSGNKPRTEEDLAREREEFLDVSRRLGGESGSAAGNDSEDGKKEEKKDGKGK